MQDKPNTNLACRFNHEKNTVFEASGSNEPMLDWMTAIQLATSKNKASEILEEICKMDKPIEVKLALAFMAGVVEGVARSVVISALLKARKDTNNDTPSIIYN